MRKTGQLIIASAAVALFIASPARAQFTWTNAAGGNWSVGANWGGTGPAAGGSATTTLTFPLGASYIATNDFPGVFNLNQLTFSNTAGTVTLNASAGGSLNFTGTSPAINMNGAGNGIISMPVSLDQTNTTIASTGAGNLTINGAITEAVTNTSNLIKTSAGDLTLTGGGSFRQLSVQNGNGFITAGTYALTADTGTGNVNSGLRVAAGTGGTATVTVSGAGTVINNTENIYLADQAGSTGTSTLIVRDGAVINSTGTATTGRLGVGNGGGNANLQVLNGGVINTNQLFAARIAGSPTNTVLVDGPGSTIHAVTQLSFGTAGIGTMTVQNGGTARADGSINIGRANTAGVSGSVTVTGPTTTMTSGTSTVAGQLNVGLAGPGSLTIDNGATVRTGDPALAAQMTVGWIQTTAGAGTLTIQNGGTLTVNGTSFTALDPASTANITVTGAGSRFVVNPVGTTGGFINMAGNGGTPGGTSTLTVANGGTFIAQTTAILHTGATVNANTGGTFSAGLLVDGANLTSVGNISTQSGGVVAITGIANTFGTYNGVISGGGSLVVSGVPNASNQILGGTSTYTGGTTINGGGRLAISGQISGPVTVNNGGTLLGGTAGFSPGIVAGPVQVNAGGTLTGGSDPVNSPTGVLNVQGAVTMVPGANYFLLMNGNTPGGGTFAHNQLDLTGGGSINIGGASLQTSLGYSPANTNVITFINNGAVSGTFAGLPNAQQFFVGAFGGQNFAATINYTGTSVFLNNFVPVPEPLHILAIGGLGAAGLGWWKRRKKK